MVKIYEAARFNKSGGPSDLMNAADSRLRGAGIPHEFHPVGPITSEVLRLRRQQQRHANDAACSADNAADAAFSVVTS